MSTDDLLLNKLKIQSGYKEVIKSLQNNLKSNNFHAHVKKYADAKKSLKLRDFPEIISDGRMDSREFLLQQTTLYSQADFFGDAAINAPQNVAPILYHYAENSLYAFFVYSLNSHIPPHVSSHGLNIEFTNELETITVKLKNIGLFSRIVDCYSICKATTPFSSLNYNSSSNNYEVVDNEYSLIKEPTLTINDIISLREKSGQQADGYFYDLFDFILLFFGSSLARYRPYLWDEIIRGEKNTYNIWFEQCFERFELFRFRLVQSLIDMNKTGSLTGCILHEIDLITNQKMRG